MPTEVDASPTEPAETRRGPVAALWAAPLWAHAAALLLVLLVILPFTETGPVWLADEGGMRLQAELLADGEPWSLPRPFFELDPEERTVPIEAATIDGDQYTPFAKHVAASWLLAGATLIFGSLGPILLSILATVAAAWTVGWIAEDRRAGTGRWTLWALGVASPLLIYSYTVTSHTIGVALAAVAVAAAIAVFDGRSWWALALLAAVALGPQFRNEALLFGVALGIGVALVSLRPVRWGRVVLAVGTVAAAGAGFAANLMLEQSVAGAVSNPIDETAPSFIERVVSAGASVLARVSTDDAVAAVAVFALAAATVLLIGWLRLEPDASSRHFLHAGLVGAGALAVLVTGPTHIYGIVLAFPLLVGGLAAIRRDVWTIPHVPFLLAVAAVYTVAVLLTQDYGGGGVQWGGRYLFLALPAALPVAVAAIATALDRIDRRTGTVVIAALVIGAAAVSVTSIRLIADRHRATEGAVATVVAAAEAVGPAGDGGGPVVFSSFTNIGRMAFASVGDVRYFLMYEPDAAEYIDRFAEGSGVDRFVLLAAGDEETQRFLDHGFVIVGDPTLIGPGRLLVMGRLP